MIVEESTGDFFKVVGLILVALLLIVAMFAAMIFGITWLIDADSAQVLERCIDEAIQTLVYSGELSYSDAVVLVAEHVEVLCG